MKKALVILFLAFVSAFTADAQQRTKKTVELGGFLGGSYYIGDLNPNGHFKFTKPAAGLIFRYNFNSRAALRTNILYGTIEAHDSYAGNAAQKQRNLSFRSSLFEFSEQFEFNFFDYKIGTEKNKFTPYLFIGIAVFNFNPKGLINNSWVSLQPLSTEGEGLEGGSKSKRYKLTQISIPFGMGIKTNVAQKIGLTIEWGIRKTFTDYLDDVSGRYYNPNLLHSVEAAKLSDPSLGTDPSKTNVGRQRGNPTTKDWYAFAGMALTLKMKEKRPKCPSANR